MPSFYLTCARIQTCVLKLSAKTVRVRTKRGAAGLFTFKRSDTPRLDLNVNHGSNFKAWLKEWTAYHAVLGLNEQDGETQYHVLRLTFLRDTATVIDNLGLPAEDRKKIDKIIQALRDHMRGAINETVERRNFRKRRQNQHESFNDYMVASRDLVKTCCYCFNACVNNALRDQIIEGLLDGDTVEELLRQKNINLVRTMQICRVHEAAKQQREETKGGHQTIAAMSSYKSKSSKTVSLIMDR